MRQEHYRGSSLVDNYLVTQFLFKGGGSYTLCVLREDALKLVQQHSERSLPVTVGTHNVRCRQDVLPFSVLSEEVLVILLNPLPPEIPQAGQVPYGHGPGSFHPSRS